MSEFSELLDYYIKTKNIKIQALSHLCSLDRSTMYKFINGTRTPSSLETVHSLSRHMALSPTENAGLLEAYYISAIGKTTYYQRKNTLDFLLYLSENQEFTRTFSPPEYAMANFSDMDCELLPLSGQSQINNMIYYVLAGEAALANGQIRLIVQADTPYLFDLLFSLGQSANHSKPVSSLTIEHIICLSHTDTNFAASAQSHNISCLKAILPLFACPWTYKPYFYYDNPVSHFSRLSITPFLVLTSRHAVAFSTDMKHGFFYQEPDTVSAFHNIFEAQLTHTSVLGQKISGDAVDPDLYLDIENENITISYLIQAEPLFRALLEPVHIEKYVTAKIPNRKESVKLIAGNLRDYFDSNENMPFVSTFTENGILNFIKTGTFSETPHGFFEPISYEDCLYLLEKMYQLALQGYFLLLKNSLSNFSLSAHIDISKSYVAFLLMNAKDDLTAFLIRETYLIEGFFDFASSMQESGLAASTEESAAYLKSILDNPPKRF